MLVIVVVHRGCSWGGLVFASPLEAYMKIPSTMKASSQEGHRQIRASKEDSGSWFSSTAFSAINATLRPRSDSQGWKKWDVSFKSFRQPWPKTLNRGSHVSYWNILTWSFSSWRQHHQPTWEKFSKTKYLLNYVYYVPMTICHSFTHQYILKLIMNDQKFTQQ